MSEVARKLSAFDAFAQTQLTYEEAEQKAKTEVGAPKVDRFRTGEDGEYTVRILPLAPDFDEEGNILPMKRKGYEYAVHQFFMSIKLPAKKGRKSKKVSIPVIRTTDEEVGYSVDLIDTYVKIAKEKYADDADLIKLLTSNSYSGGIRWNYQHAIMVIDVSSEKEHAKGPQIWQCSHSQYKDIDAAKMRLWKELRADGGQESCPISGLTDAYPVKIIRNTESNKTEYTFEIGRKTLDITEKEVTKLLDLPRIPEQIYRYTRYQMEATLVFLQQYDEEHDMDVCTEPDFVEAAKKLAGELPQDDNTHFDLAKVDSNENNKEEVTIDSLWTEYDAIIDQGLNEKSDEYQELREKIRQFIEDNNLDVFISRSKSNQQLLEDIDDAMSAAKVKPKQETETETKEAPARRASAKAKPAPKEEEADNDVEKEAKEEAEEERPRRRRARPGSDAAEDKAEVSTEDGDADEGKTEEEEEAPRRRLHSRRIR